MARLPEANSIDLMFVTGMIPHHQSAIDMGNIAIEEMVPHHQMAVRMSRMELARGGDPRFARSLAESPPPRPRRSPR